MAQTAISMKDIALASSGYAHVRMERHKIKLELVDNLYNLVQGFVKY